YLLCLPVLRLRRSLEELSALRAPNCSVRASRDRKARFALRAARRARFALRASCLVVPTKQISAWRPRCFVGLLSLLKDLHDPPALRRGQRPGLHQQHPVADAARVLLVVRLQLAGVPHDLAVQRMLDPVLNLDDHSLVHLVADDEALADLTPSALLHVAWLELSNFLGHDATSTGADERPSSRSRMIV